MLNRRALTIATVGGTALQVAMVVAGHLAASVKDLFAVGGMSISLVAGVVYAVLSPRGVPSSPAQGGVLAGGICALLGIAVSFALGDVPPSLLALGTLSSAVTGALGGWAASKLRGGSTGAGPATAP